MCFSRFVIFLTLDLNHSRRSSARFLRETVAVSNSCVSISSLLVQCIFGCLNLLLLLTDITDRRPFLLPVEGSKLSQL